MVDCDVWSGRASQSAMRVPVQVPALVGSLPEADDETRWEVADRSSKPEPGRERYSIATTRLSA